MKCHFIYDRSDIEDLRSYLKSNDFPYIVIDVETDNKIEKKANLFGVGLCFEDEVGIYIPIRKNNGDKWWDGKTELEICSLIYDLCHTKKLIGHNIIYDVLVLLYNWNINLTSLIYSDTILLKHSIDEERPHGLKETAVKYLGSWADKAQKDLYENIKKNGGKTLKDNVEMWRADTDILGVYCAWDTMLTFKLFTLFENTLIQEGLHKLFYEEEVMPLYREVTIPMKIKGFPIDVEYFNKLNKDIDAEINSLERTIQNNISMYVQEYEKNLLNDLYPCKRSGNFPKEYAKIIDFPLPTNKNGDITLARKELEKILELQLENHRKYLRWILGEEELDEATIYEIQRYIHLSTNKYIFNLNSGLDLKWLFFTKLQETPLSFTEKNEPQVDEDFLESIKKHYHWVQFFIDYKKLIKLKSTYIEGVLERQIDGVLYASFLQFGTTSGRFSCTNPNLQNLPRLKKGDSGLSELVLKYVNNIKRGFIAPAGYKIVNADFSQLEPRAFSEAAGDPFLQQVFIAGEDLYGSIAVRIFGLDCTPNEVKDKYLEKRQACKVIALAVVYGAEAGRIAQLMNISYNEAQQIINDYLESYPKLKLYMEECDRQVCSRGYIKTKLGRVRHLPMAKELFRRYGKKLLNKRWASENGLEEIRWKFKNMLNLAKNFPIQGVAAHIMNRASIAISRKLKEKKLDAYIVAQVHDELTCISEESVAEEVKNIMKDCMENTVKLSVPLKADPLIADRWGDAK